MYTASFRGVIKTSEGQSIVCLSLADYWPFDLHNDELHHTNEGVKHELSFCALKTHFFQLCATYSRLSL